VSVNRSSSPISPIISSSRSSNRTQHALLAEAADGDARLLAAEDEVRVVLGHAAHLPLLLLLPLFPSLGVAPVGRWWGCVVGESEEESNRRSAAWDSNNECIQHQPSKPPRPGDPRPSKPVPSHKTIHKTKLQHVCFGGSIDRSIEGKKEEAAPSKHHHHHPELVGYAAHGPVSIGMVV